ncbi:hypothetical protein F4677DRAFT_29450 [Hypoxylon crocopeplum]|nr:hypothetical protein F4677DRAFT_29450 [Hypoxylon crocopeplum]
MLEMSNSEQDEKISEWSQNIKTSFEYLLGKLEGREHNGQLPTKADVADVFDRYLLWVGSLGALHPRADEGSLEYLLSAAPEIRDQICDLLDDLQEAVDDLTLISLSNGPNGGPQFSDAGLIEMDSESGFDNTTIPRPSSLDEVQTILEVMDQCLRSLFRINALVQRAGSRYLFKRSSQSLSYAISKYPKLGHPDGLWLADRIDNASAKRRGYIENWHRRKSAWEDGSATKLLNEHAILPSVGSTQFTQPEPNPPKEDAISPSVTSAIFESPMGPKLPNLEVVSPDSRPFECPICLTSQLFKEDKAWKTHAFSDLKAYVCTFRGIECEDKLFGSRDAWFDHELQFHRSKYLCPLCSEASSDKASMAFHIESVHGSFTAKEISMLVTAGRAVPTHFKADCPFCDEWSGMLTSRGDSSSESVIRRGGELLVSRSQFKGHVASHQEQLATYALPELGGIARLALGNNDFVQQLLQHWSFFRTLSVQRQDTYRNENPSQAQAKANAQDSFGWSSLPDWDLHTVGLLVEVLLGHARDETDQEAKQLSGKLFQECVSRGEGNSDRFYRLYYELGDMFMKRGMVQEAREFAGRAFEGRKQMEPMQHILVRESASSFVRILELDQAYDEARDIQEWARTVLHLELLPQHEHTGPSRRYC